MSDSFATRRTLDVNGTSYAYYSLPALAERLDNWRARQTQAVAMHPKD